MDGKFVSDTLALIMGAGEGTGAALARRFVADGLKVCLVRRDADALERLRQDLSDEGIEVAGRAADATREADVTRLVQEIDQELGPIGLAVYNVATLIRGSVVELESAQYRHGLRLAYGAFLMGREVARGMLERGTGTIIFTSSTASLRGAAGNAALASGRFAIRALAESLARELGPAGIHVVHLAMDGMIDSPALRAALPDFATRFPIDSLLQPDAIAEQCLRLHRQPRSAWSHQVVLRPWSERW